MCFTTFTPLDLFGWKPVKEDVLEKLYRHDKVILLFPHTHSFDTFITFFYTIFDKGVREKRDRMRFIVWDEAYKRPHYRPFFDYLKAIPVPHYTKKNTGAMERICETLDEMDKFVLLISPKGTCNKADWRSGWYHLAKKYDAAIVTMGPDFEKHEMILTGEPMKIEGRSYEEMEALMKDQYKEIVPYYPNQEVVDVRKHSGTSMVNYGNIIVLVLILVILFGLLIVMVWKPHVTDKVYVTTMDWWQSKGR